MTTLGSDFKPSGRATRKHSGDSQKKDEYKPKSYRPDESTLSQRTRSLEVSERLLGSTAF